MDELISRAYVLAEYDRQHKGPPGGARKIIEDSPAVDAISVEWLRKEAMNDGGLIYSVIRGLLMKWWKEKEAEK